MKECVPFYCFLNRDRANLTKSSNITGEWETIQSRSDTNTHEHARSFLLPYHCNWKSTWLCAWGKKVHSPCITEVFQDKQCIVIAQRTTDQIGQCFPLAVIDYFKYCPDAALDLIVKTCWGGGVGQNKRGTDVQSPQDSLTNDHFSKMKKQQADQSGFHSRINSLSGWL